MSKRRKTPKLRNTGALVVLLAGAGFYQTWRMRMALESGRDGLKKKVAEAKETILDIVKDEAKEILIDKALKRLLGG